jgi:hypothetical protein
MVHPENYPMVAKISFSALKRQEREADHSPATSAEVKETLIYAVIVP